MRKHTVILAMVLCALGLVTCVMWGERDAERYMRRRAEAQLMQVQADAQAAQQTGKDAQEALRVGKTAWNEALDSIAQERDSLLTENLSLAQQAEEMRLALAASEAAREEQGLAQAAAADQTQNLAQALARTPQQAAELALRVNKALASVTDLTAENQRLSRQVEAAEQALEREDRREPQASRRSICRSCEDPLLRIQVKAVLEALQAGKQPVN